jgi:hypothetical protein
MAQPKIHRGGNMKKLLFYAVFVLGSTLAFSQTTDQRDTTANPNPNPTARPGYTTAAEERRGGGSWGWLGLLGLGGLAGLAGRRASTYDATRDYRDTGTRDTGTRRTA